MKLLNFTKHLLLTSLFSLCLFSESTFAGTTTQDQEYHVYILWGQLHTVTYPAARAYNVVRWEPPSGSLGTGDEESGTYTYKELTDGTHAIKFNKDQDPRTRNTSGTPTAPPSSWINNIKELEFGVIAVAVPVDDDGEDVFTDPESDFSHTFAMWDGSKESDVQSKLLDPFKDVCGALIGKIIYDKNKKTYAQNQGPTPADKDMPDFATLAFEQIPCSACNDPNAAGDTDCDLGSVAVSMPIGRHRGSSAGALRLRAETIDGNLADPERLDDHSVPKTVERVMKGGKLRQLRTSEQLIVIDSGTTTGSYSVKWYAIAQAGQSKVDELYPVTGAPHATTTLTGTADELTVSSERAGGSDAEHSKSWHYSGVEAGGEVEWRMASGTAPDGTGAKQVESMREYMQGTLLCKRHTTYGGDGVSAAADELMKYRNIPTLAGKTRWYPSERIMDPDGEARTESYSYDLDAASPSYGQKTLIEHADGSWEKLVYFGAGAAGPAGRIWKKITPLGDSSPAQDDANHRVTEYGYVGTTAGAPVERQTEKVAGQIIVVRFFNETITSNKTRIAIEELAPGPGFVQGAPENLRTERWTYPPTSAVTQGGKPWKVLRPGQPTVWQNYWQENLGAPWNTTGNLTQTLTGVVDANGVLSEGTKREAVVDITGRQISDRTWKVSGGVSLLIAEELNLEFDSEKRATKTSTLRGVIDRVYGCCGLERETDENGLTTFHHYDTLGRQIATTHPDGTGERLVLDGAGRVLARYSVAVGGAETLAQENHYDDAGRLDWSKDSRGNQTSFAETNTAGSGLQRTTTNADLGTIIEQSYRDGSLKSRVGTATQPARREISVVGGRVVEKEIRLVEGSEAEWTQTSRDGAGRNVTIKAPAMIGGGVVALQTNEFDSAGRLWKTTDADGVVTLRTYTAAGEPDLQGIDVNRNGTLETDGTERVTRTASTWTTSGGEVAEVTTTTGFLASGPVDISRRETRVKGTGGIQSSYGRVSTISIATDPATATRVETITNPDSTQNVRTLAQGRVVKEERKGADGALLAQSDYGYDAYGRLETTTVLGSGVTTTTYVPGSDLVASVTTPDPGDGLGPRTTSYIEYDAMNRLKKTRLPDASIQERSYFKTGAHQSESGSQTYPVGYTYDDQGRMKTMTTTGAAGPAVTTWNYHPGRGLLLNKQYQDGTGPTYTYTNAGRLLTREWARNITTNYGYNNAGELVGIDYSDATPDVSGITYDGLGRQITATDAAGAVAKTYSLDGQPADETYTGGILDGLTVSRTYDALLRRSGLSTLNPQLSTLSYTYGANGRLITISTDDGYTATQQWQDNLGLIGDTIHTSGSVTLTQKREYDALGRLTSIQMLDGTAVKNSTGYAHDLLSRRVKATREDGSHFGYGYDALGQVTSGIRKWPDETPVPGESFGYTFDTIGNRTQTTTNGRTESYTPNLLNQYEQRQIDDKIDVTGLADPAADVTVNGTAATRSQAGWFHGIVDTDNSTSPVWETISITASQGAVTDNTGGHAFLAQTPEAFDHDLDGNLTRDGRFTYTWDGENRLIGVETIPEARLSGAPGVRLTFAYDAQSRRISKKVEDWNPQTLSYQPRATRLFLYDGWNLLAEFLPSSFTLLTSYVWGIDLSGTLQGAGGVGGLLRVSDLSTINSQASTHAASYDGNGNVIGLYSLAGAGQTATYRYGPFGETLEASAPAASLNPFRFSSKYDDAETGLLYYGFRYYNPETGRWLNRDPIAEQGGVNLYGFLGNQSIHSVDPLGKEAVFTFSDGTKKTAITPAEFIEISKNAAIGSIARLDIYGHAKMDFQGFDTKTTKNSDDGAGLQSGGNGDVYIQGSDGETGPQLKDVAATKFISGGKVYLHGCRVAKGDDNIARDVSLELRDVPVTGSPNATGAGYNPRQWFNSISSKTYINGAEQ